MTRPNTPMTTTHIDRRNLLLSGAALTASTILPAGKTFAQVVARTETPADDLRMLGPVGVAPIGLGCQWSPSGDPAILNDQYNGTIARETAIRMIREAVDGGVTLIDTAEAYGPFLSEEVVGEALQNIRDRIPASTSLGSLPPIAQRGSLI